MSEDRERVFDPTPYLIEIAGRKHLDVKWRLLWLRTEHPDAEIETQETVSGDGWVQFRARVSIPGLGSATAHARQTSKDAAEGWYEKAETRALGRALASLGYGLEYATELDDDTGRKQIAEPPITFPRPRPRAMPAGTPSTTQPGRTRRTTSWDDFWTAVRDHKEQHPEFDPGGIVGDDPDKKMSAAEAMRLFRRALTEDEQER